MKTDPFQRRRDSINRDPSTSPGERPDIHAEVIRRIQRQVDTLGFRRSLSEDATGAVSLWQRNVIDQISEMLTELILSSYSVIDGLNKNPKGIDMDMFIMSLEACADNAAQLADQIASFADFGKTNGRNELQTNGLDEGLDRWKERMP